MSSRTDRLQVIFEVAGDGKLKAALGEIGALGDSAAGKMDKTAAASDRMSAAAKRAGAILGGTIVAGLGLVIKNTIEAERVDAQLEARLKSTAGAAGMSKQALDELATATARKTTFDDESIKTTETMLLTFTRIHADVFPKALEAVTNMSVAMGTDLEGAAIQVGKALNDPIQGISALSRVGVTFSEDQKKVIKALEETGQTSKAQALILKELETEFGGAAEAARDTFGGALQALMNTLGDLTEGSSGSLSGATEGVNDLIDTLNDPNVQAGAASIVQGLTDILGAAAQTVAMLGELDGWLRKVYISQNELQAGQRKLDERDWGSSVLKGTGALLRGNWAEANKQADMAYRAAFSGDTVVDFRNVRGGAKQGANSGDLARAGVDAGFNFAADNLMRAGVPVKTDKPKRTGGGGGRGGGAAKKREMPDFAEADARALKELVEQAGRADEQFAKLAATMAGPLAEAEYEHQQNLAHIDEIGKQAGRTSQEIVALKEQETARYNEQKTAIEESLNPMKQLLESYQAEIEAIGAGNAERAMMNTLRREGIDLASSEAQAYLAAAKVTDETARTVASAQQDQIQTMDSLRDSARGFLDDLSHGVGVWDSLKTAADSFADTLFQIASKKLIEQIFGAYGTSGGGGGSGGDGGLGNIFGSILGALFGNGKAQGGQTSSGQIYPVTEYGEPELFRSNGRTWLLPGSNGYVQPMGAGNAAYAGGGGDQYFSTSINVRGDVSTRTARQLATERGQFMAREARR